MMHPSQMTAVPDGNRIQLMKPVDDCDRMFRIFRDRLFKIIIPPIRIFQAWIGVAVAYASKVDMVRDLVSLRKIDSINGLDEQREKPPFAGLASTAGTSRNAAGDDIDVSLAQFFGSFG